jgi:hypothetical protein
MPRWLAVLVGLGVLVGGAIAIVLAFAARDASRVTAVPGPGQAFPDLCAAHEDPPTGFTYNSTPPTSGPHRPALVQRDRGRLGDDELLHALELGNVVLAYGADRPPHELARLQEQVAGPFDAELAAAGQAVILGRRDDVDGVVALAWTHRLKPTSAGDPALREFTEHWLGRGARAAGAPCPASG